MRTAGTELLQYLVSFFKNPVFAIRILPSSPFSVIFVFQLLLTVLSISASSLIQNSGHINLLIVLVFTVIATAALFFLTGTLYYALILLQNARFDFPELHKLTVLSHICFFLFFPLAPWFPPFVLIGSAASLTLLTVGLVENFELQKKTVVRLNLVLFLLFFLVWLKANS